MPIFKELCRRLEVWVNENLPGALASFNPSATEQQIAKYEQAIGFKLPADVRGWYRWHNGQKRWPEQSIFFGDEVLSLTDSLKEWQFWQTVADMNEEVAEHCTSTPDGAIVAAYSLPGWIPLAQQTANCSNYLGIDLNPGPNGTKGQVIYFGRDVETKCVLGASFGDFLAFIVEEMEGGRITVGVPSGTKESELPWTKHSLCAKSHFEGLALRLHKMGKFDGRRLHVDGAEKALR